MYAILTFCLFDMSNSLIFFYIFLHFEFMHYGGSVYLDSFTEFVQLHNSIEMIKHMVKHSVFMVVRGKMDLNEVQYRSLNKYICE